MRKILIFSLLLLLVIGSVYFGRWLDFEKPCEHPKLIARPEQPELLPEAHTPIPLSSTIIPKEWEPQLSESQQQEIGLYQSWESPLLVIQATATDVWFVTPTSYKVLWRFNKSTRMLIAYELAFTHDPPGLLFRKAGNLLVAFATPGGSSLYQYRPVDDTFVLMGRVEVSHLYTDHLHAVLKEDATGNLWLSHGAQLVQLDTEGNALETQIVDDPFRDFFGNDIYGMETAHDGSVWLISNYGRLSRFSPDTGELERIDLAYDDASLNYLRAHTAGYPYRLFEDSKRRLWVNNAGWFEYDDDRNDEQPLLYSIMPRPMSGYAFEVSDGRLWSIGEEYTTTVDLVTGNWCVISTLRYTAITKDEKGTVWIIGYLSDGKVQLYSYSP